MTPRAQRNKSTRAMQRHNRARGKAGGARYFSPNALLWRRLWVERNPRKAQETYSPEQIREAVG